jgi:hypothetical protein
MPPRRSARAAAAEERATTALSPLPLSVVLHIFSLLPVDCRLRCAEVCRGWRSVLLERSLWTRLDLTPSSGVGVPVGAEHHWGAMDSLVRCAAARAGGSLQSLRVDVDFVSDFALLQAITANEGALQELHARAEGLIQAVGFDVGDAEAFLAAASQLRVFAINLRVDADDVAAVRRALRNEAPFGPLRVECLDAELGGADEADVIALAADVAAHASMARLTLRGAPLQTPAALDAVVDAALARRMHTVALVSCGIPPDPAPALARLLGGDALATLECCNMQLLDEPAAAVLAAALRANATLTSLTLYGAGMFSDAAAAAVLLGALTSHASLRVLDLQANQIDIEEQAAAGAALGALVATNAPALTKLDVSSCDLGDDGLRSLFEALPHNTHLRTLSCLHNGITEAFARDVLLPAVRANTSLRKLKTLPHVPSSVEAERIVNSRAAA